MAVFLSIGLVVFGNWFLPVFGVGSSVNDYRLENKASEASISSSPMLMAMPVVNYYGSGGYIEDSFVIDGYDSNDSLAASLEGYSQSPGIFSTRDGLINYAVKQGDTLSQIAADFKISVETITAANPEIRAKALRIGQEIKILPVSGIVYEIKSGDTLESVADFFNLRPDQIKDINGSVNFATLGQGDSLVIPGSRALRSRVRTTNALPDLANYFVQPTQGYNWGRLHNYNAVDIANACGSPIISSAEGLIVDVAAEGWNSGYGHFVLIEHPNGTKTRYAHLGSVSVNVGDYVKQGQDIGVMGNTGNVHGPTGCHLHFEITGAKNPFAS